MKIQQTTPAMPLTSLTSCYKTLPSYFADQMTRHVRKRRDPRKNSPQQDDHEVEATTRVIPHHPATAWSDVTDDVTMTKRSRTPLATMSDNESEDESPDASATILAPHPPPRDSEKRNSPSSEQDINSSFRSTLSYIIRPKRAQISPRTAISLDNVDLWEDSDSEDRGPSPFDRIDGISINPRATIDFSDLRRSRSPVDAKRNKLDDNKQKESSTGERSQREAIQTIGFAGPRALTDLQAELTAAKSRLLESRTVKPRVRSLNRKLMATQILPDKKPPDLKSKPQGEAKAKTKLGSPMETNRGTTHFQYPRLNTMDSPFSNREVLVKPPTRTPTMPETQNNSATPSMPHVTVTAAHVIQTTNQNSGNGFTMPQVNSTPIRTHQITSSPINTNTTPAMPPVHNTPNQSTKTTAKRNELSRINRKIRTTLTPTQNAKTPGIVQQQTQQPIRGDLRRVQELDVGGSDDSTGSSGSSPDRKVKFNNYVTVRQGDCNTVDTLRESNNSAQTFKQKYLGGSSSNAVSNNTGSVMTTQPPFKSKIPARIKLVF